ncbi:MAG: hypothetical protein M4579_005070 [Chaenotheca gracillima]|nr:MAG: hypothetical protein M4579_005070 [Chaenotheca gracillima]
MADTRGGANEQNVANPSGASGVGNEASASQETGHVELPSSAAPGREYAKHPDPWTPAMVTDYKSYKAANESSSTNKNTYRTEKTAREVPASWS